MINSFPKRFYYCLSPAPFSRLSSQSSRRLRRHLFFSQRLIAFCQLHAEADRANKCNPFKFLSSVPLRALREILLLPLARSLQSLELAELTEIPMPFILQPKADCFLSASC